MQQLINFFIKNKTLVLFLVLFTIAISLTIKSHEFHRAKLFNSSNYIIGGVYGISHSVSQYFNLLKENKLLLEENSKLKTQLFNHAKHSTAEPSMLFLKLNLGPTLSKQPTCFLYCLLQQKLHPVLIYVPQDRWFS